MNFLIDTDVCSAQIKGHPLVFNRFIQHGGGLAVSVVTVAELVIWHSRAAAPDRRKRLAPAAGRPQAVDAAYAAEMVEAASKLQRGLPVLVECDKDLAGG